MRNRFKRSMKRLLASQQRLSDLLWPFVAPKTRAPVRLRKSPVPAPRLVEVTGFGSNPGNLRMYEYVPPGLKRGAPVVVVLHGCRQSVASYDRAAGWTSLARLRGFAVVYAEQKAGNNPRQCFNWFRPSEVTRDRGELLSIRQMIAHVSARVRPTAGRVYITGLSAGGAMAAAMLANYPDLFGGGAIIAGLPFGAARDATRALEAMRHAPERTAAEWGDLVRKASPDRKRGPVVSIWQGTRDDTVSASNAEALLDQWRDVYGIDPADYVETRGKNRKIRRWHGRDGRVRVEYHEVAGLGHGTPVTRGNGAGQAAASEPFMLEAGFSSTLEIAKGWGLVRRKPAA